MWLSDLAVRRPVLATVTNLLLVVFGAAALLGIQVREYPDIDPPIVSISTNYPGASAAVIESKITQLLEDRIAGIEGIRSLTSSSRDGRSSITVEFNLSRDVDDAANDIRDRVSRVLDELPAEADPPEIEKSDVDANPILWMVITSDRMSDLELTDYAQRYLVDRFGALDGVSQIRLGGERLQSMRVWLQRTALAARGLTVADVEAALRAQNVERPAGRLDSADREFTLRTARPFLSPEQFGALVIHRGDDGYAVRLRDVATVEVGPVEARSVFRANGSPAVGLGVVKQSKANTLTVARAAKAEMERVATELPEGMRILVNTDNSLFIESSLRAVSRTLLEAGVIVILVIFMFLGDLRTTLIPAVTVPISLLASFMFLSAFGFSLNILTMLALVLAIGLVVDDTIVVVENIHRRMTGDKPEPPLLAAFNGTREVGFAVLATTLVLIAVFAPLAFLQGNVGRLFREFALALSGAVFCSMIVSLTLSPVLAGLLLRAGGESRLSQAVHRLAERSAGIYRALLARWIARPWIAAVLIVALLGGMALLFRTLHSEVTPLEDRGQFFVQVRGPEGASFDYTVRQMLDIESRIAPLLGQGEVDRMVVRIPGGGGSGAEVNTGMTLISTTPWTQRERSSEQIAAEIGAWTDRLTGVRASIQQRGSFGGRPGAPVQVVIGGSTFEELAEWRNRMIARIQAENPRLLRLDSDYQETRPTIEITIDLDRAGDLGVPVEEIGRTLETMLGGRRVTTYLDRGEEYDVWLQAGAAERASPADLAGIHVRGAGGALVPLSNLIRTRDVAGAAQYNRHDRLRAVTLSANLAPGYTLGEALEYVEGVARDELPATARLSYKGESRELKDASGALYLTFGLALLVVFLVLAAQFESFVHPLVIMTTVPLALFGALAALFVFGYTLNIYTQIGIIMLIGLAAKNGILIVEFANQRRDAGVEFTEALLQAAAIRLRPILMTSFATAAGVVPLIFSHDAGAEARGNLGIVVFWGVMFSTALTLFVVPALYALLARRTGSPGRVAALLESLGRVQEKGPGSSSP